MGLLRLMVVELSLWVLRWLWLRQQHGIMVVIEWQQERIKRKGKKSNEFFTKFYLK